MANSLEIYPLQSKVKQICQNHGNSSDQLLEILHKVQDFNGYLPENIFQTLASCLNISRAEVYGVVTFYHDFRQKPPAKNIIKICQSEACQSMGSAELKANVKCGLDENTAIETIYCLGNCALAPSAMVNGKIYGRLNSNSLKTIIGACDD